MFCPFVLSTSVLVNFAYRVFAADTWEPLSPLRLVFAIALPYVMARWGLRKHSLSNSGARAGLCFRCSISLCII